MFDNVALLLIAAVFAALGLLVSFFIGVEVVRLLREFFAGLSTESRVWTAEVERQRISPPQRGFDGGRQIAQFQDRETVERIITHLAEDEAESLPEGESVSEKEE